MNKSPGRGTVKLLWTFVAERLGDMLTGLIFWLPIGIIFFVGGYVYTALEGSGRNFLSLFFLDNLIHTGYGIALWIVVFLLSGFILKHTKVGDLLSGVPIIGVLFRTRGSKVISIAKLMALTPCLFLYSPTCPSYGWILSEETVSLDGKEAGFSMLNVYYPNVPSILTGQIFPVRKESVIKLDNPSREIFDMLLYSLRSPESIPWENEPEEAFLVRARQFGLQPSDYQAAMPLKAPQTGA